MSKVSHAASVVQFDHAKELRRIAVETAHELAATHPSESWHWPWVLVRRLRTLPGVTAQTDPASRVMVGAIMVAWEGMGEITHETDFDTPEALVTAVVAIWRKVLFADGAGPLEVAVAAAAERPVPVRPGLGARYAQLVCIAFHLQRAQGADPIVLPVHRLAPVLNVSATQVSRMIHAAVAVKHLELVDRDYRPGRARRYRCLVAASETA